MSKIAIYGRYTVKAPVKQRYWKLRSDGVKQRYWKKTTRTKREVREGRYELDGSGRELYNAIVKAHRIVPKGYVHLCKGVSETPREIWLGG